MEYFPPAVFDNEETVQDTKSESRDSKEVHGRNDFTMILKESSPSFL